MKVEIHVLYTAVIEVGVLNADDSYSADTKLVETTVRKYLPESAEILDMDWEPSEEERK